MNVLQEQNRLRIFGRIIGFMMNTVRDMKIGSLYQIKNYYWMLYPSKDTASAAADDLDEGTATPRRHADNWANYWSSRFSCNISYISPNSLFMLLEQDGKYYKVLSTEGMVGWIYLAPWCKDDIVEVTQ
jgi:hypothetical protein